MVNNAVSVTGCAPAEAELSSAGTGALLLFGAEPTDRALTGWRPFARRGDSAGGGAELASWILREVRLSLGERRDRDALLGR